VTVFFAALGIRKAIFSSLVLPPQLKISLFWFQILSLYPYLFDGWPLELKALFDITGFFNFELGYFGFGCDFNSTFYSFMLVKLSGPVLLWILLACIEVVIQRSFHFRAKLVTITSSVLFITNFLSVQIFSTMSQIFGCSKRSDGSFALKADPSISCFDSTWWGFASFDIISILFYCVGLPYFVWITYVKAGRTTANLRFTCYFGHIIVPYRQGACGFEVFRITFRLCFVLIRDLGLSRVNKSLWLSLLFVIQIWIEAKVRPYAQPFTNDLSLL
jgi:hypothetical protein